MGGWSLDKKRTVEESRSISTAFLKQHGYFCGFHAGGMKWTDGLDRETGSIGFSVSVETQSGEIRFQYTVGEEKESLDYRVHLTATPCHFGGKRWWFLCPLIKNGTACQRRVGKLYLAGGKYFGCRRCYDLAYESCQEHDARVNAFLKDPAQLIRATRNPGTDLVTLKALMKLEKQERSKEA